MIKTDNAVSFLDFLKKYRVEVLFLYGLLAYSFLGLYFTLKLEGVFYYTIIEKLNLAWGISVGLIYIIFGGYETLIASRKWRSFNPLEFTMIGVILVNALTFAIGVFLKNDLKYLLGDTFLFSLIPFNFFLIRNNIKSPERINQFFYFMLFSLAFTCLFPIPFGMPSFQGFKPVGFFSLFGAEAFVVVSFLLISVTTKKELSYKALFVYALIFSLWRTRFLYLFQVALALLVIVIVKFNDKIILKKIFRLFTAASLIVILLFRLGALNNAPGIYKVYVYTAKAYKLAKISIKEGIDRFTHKEITQEGNLIKERRLAEKKIDPRIALLSGKQRVFEIKEITAALKRSPWALLSGFGNGATIDLSESPDETISAVYKDRINKVHAIHIFPFAVLYRQGLLGLVSYCFLFYLIFFYFKKYFNVLREKTDQSALVFLLLFLNIFILLSTGILGNAILFMNITFGISLGLINNLFNVESYK